ncbi:hypothetical protein AB0L04_01460 [Streptomyces glaucescens]|uniref:hypothetical protein n=1 Tax=Streptomyces glaucescens TaxID=1907 RepID=UPI00344CB42A
MRLGPWGLVARIGLDVGQAEAPPPDARVTGDPPVWWVPPPGIVPADEEWMRFGLGLVAGRLDTLRSGAGVVVVRVLDWEVPMLTDHQEEVAAAAVIECLRRHHGIDGVGIGVTFDRERNRYEFTWDASSRPVGRGGASGGACRGWVGRSGAR